MRMYTCPMHPEVKQDKPGNCPKCGMKLVKEGDSSQSAHHTNVDHTQTTWKSYTPLAVIIGMILLATGTISFQNLQQGIFTIKGAISYFMIGFFLVFSGFKLMDLKGFAQGYSTYDLLAQRWFSYGYIYPFIELMFGLGMILIPQSTSLLLLELFIMLFSGVGVLVKLLKHERFQCACLGTFLKVPLTKVTLVEDFGMAALAGIMLLLK